MLFLRFLQSSLENWISKKPNFQKIEYYNEYGFLTSQILFIVRSSYGISSGLFLSTQRTKARARFLLCGVRQKRSEGMEFAHVYQRIMGWWNLKKVLAEIVDIFHFCSFFEER